MVACTYEDDLKSVLFDHLAVMGLQERGRCLDPDTLDITSPNLQPQDVRDAICRLIDETVLTAFCVNGTTPENFGFQFFRKRPNVVQLIDCYANDTPERWPTANIRKGWVQQKHLVVILPYNSKPSAKGEKRSAPNDDEDEVEDFEN